MIKISINLRHRRRVQMPATRDSNSKPGTGSAATADSVTHQTLEAPSITNATFETTIFIQILIIVVVIVVTIRARFDGSGGGRPLLHGIHPLEVNPRRVEPVTRRVHRPLQLRPVAFPELLHLVAALYGSLGRTGERAPPRDGVGDLLPVVGPEIPTAEGVPLVPIRIDQSHGLVVGPARRREPPGGGWRGRGLLLGRRQRWVLRGRRRTGHGKVGVKDKDGAEAQDRK